MLSVVNSGKFILTLQSTPPFVIESIFALALAVLLAVPLITNLQSYLEKPSKRKRNIRNKPSNESNESKKKFDESNKNENSSERIRRAVVMHYPAPISIDTSSSSDLELEVGTFSRRSASTPNVRSNCGGDGWFNNGNDKTAGQRDDQRYVHEFVKKIKSRKDAMLDGSSSFVATNSELPIIDISTFNYNSYRHKLIEASLKKRYKESQPPGDVIFNSIHLNTTDSTLGVRLNEEYDHSFFDFVEEYYDATAGMSKKEMEFLHPLDHFLVRGGRKRETSEKATETINCTGNQTDERGNPVDNKPIDRHNLDKNGNISKVRGKNFSGTSNKPENVSSRSMDSRKNFTEKGASFIDSRARTRKSSNETLNSRKPVSSIVKAAKDSINVGSSSSEELGSVYSESEKQQPRNATSNHSRDSSGPPSRGRTATRKLLPWITGNPTVSFNRKYGNKSPETLDGSAKRKVRSSERPSRKLYFRTASPRPKSANLMTRKKSYQNSSEEKFLRSNDLETGILNSKISSRPSVALENNRCEGTMVEKITSRMNYQDQDMDVINFEGSSRTMTSCVDDRANLKSTSEGFEYRRNNEKKPRNDISPKKETRRRLGAGLSNLDKTRELSRGNKSDRCSRDKTDCSRSDIESRDTLVLATNVSRTEKENFRSEVLSKDEHDDSTNTKDTKNEENMKEELKLPDGDSKVGLAMRSSLKNYIKTLKQILKDGGDVDMVDLASLSLKDAISPELESILSSSELKELQDLLNIAEIKSNLATKDVMVL